ncbi:uncharacterized protein LOC141642730 [Silene latifolia]|uniref:uncharacterized protein LOC141642730 n=1 Tax=Silene latifolia TaxID=37657 RepID=UPI003D781507
MAYVMLTFACVAQLLSHRKELQHSRYGFRKLRVDTPAPICCLPVRFVYIEWRQHLRQQTRLESILSPHTENVESLLEVKTAFWYSMTAQESEAYLDYIENKLRTTKLYVQVVPTTGLSRTRYMEWVLQKVSLIQIPKNAGLF